MSSARLLFLWLTACGQIEGLACPRINVVTCCAGMASQCVCVRAICSPGDKGAWRALGDSCIGLCQP